MPQVVTVGVPNCHFNMETTKHSNILILTMCLRPCVHHEKAVAAFIWNNGKSCERAGCKSSETFCREAWSADHQDVILVQFLFQHGLASTSFPFCSFKVALNGFNLTGWFGNHNTILFECDSWDNGVGVRQLKVLC